MSDYREGMLSAARLADQIALRPYEECECLGLADPETGIRECNIDVRGGDCLCDVHAETAREIAAKIRSAASAIETPVQPS